MACGIFLAQHMVQALIIAMTGHVAEQWLLIMTRTSPPLQDHTEYNVTGMEVRNSMQLAGWRQFCVGLKVSTWYINIISEFTSINQAAGLTDLNRNLLLAKIFNFGKYVCLTVCQFVCLSVCLSVQMKDASRIQAAPFDQSSPNLTWMCILVMGRNPFII